jgi:DNA-directed RNA polymerase specialized sigma24 family protein
LDRVKIITDLYESPEVHAALEKMQPPELRDDLRQEMFLVLLEIPTKKFKELHELNRVKGYLVRTMLNMIQSNKSMFYKKFRSMDWQRVVEFEDTGIIDESNHEYHQLLGTVDESLTDVYWYDATLMRLYAECGENVMEVSRRTGIPYKSIYPIIHRTRKKIKDKLK